MKGYSVWIRLDYKADPTKVVIKPTIFIVAKSDSLPHLYCIAISQNVKFCASQNATNVTTP